MTDHRDPPPPTYTFQPMPVTAACAKALEHAFAELRACGLRFVPGMRKLEEDLEAARATWALISTDDIPLWTVTVDLQAHTVVTQWQPDGLRAIGLVEQAERYELARAARVN
jgi:hypothetical protein